MTRIIKPICHPLSPVKTSGIVSWMCLLTSEPNPTIWLVLPPTLYNSVPLFERLILSACHDYGGREKQNDFLMRQNSRSLTIEGECMFLYKFSNLGFLAHYTLINIFIIQATVNELLTIPKQRIL